MSCNRLIRNLLFISLLPLSLSAADISGRWTFHVEFRLGSGDPAFNFVQSGEKLTGTYHGRFVVFPLSGTVKDDQLEFTFFDEKQRVAKYKGMIVGDTITGTAKYPFPAGTGHFQGKRSK